MRQFGTVVLFLCIIVSGAGAQTPTPPYKIGIILPLTGAGAAYGGYARNGVDLALAHLSPEDRARIEVKIEDDGLDPARTVTAFQSLLNQSGVDALIVWASSSGHAVRARTEGAKIPLLAVASDPAISAGKSFTFTHWPMSEDEARALYDVLAKEQRKRVAVVTLTHAGAQALVTSFKALADKKVVDIVFEEEAPGDLKDFRSILNRLRMVPDLDAIIPIFFPGQLAAFAKQTRNLGIRAPFYGFETFEDKDEVKAADGQLLGAIYSTGADPSPEFMGAYQTKYPDVSWYTACNLYDSIHLLAAATRTSRDPAVVSQFLKDLKDYHGACGTYSASGDNRFRLPVTVRQVTNSGFVSYEPLPAVRIKRSRNSD